MKINDSILKNIPDSVTEKTDATTPAELKVVEQTAKELVQIQRALPKADSVEMKTNSFYNFENGPKLDSSKTDLASEVPAAMIPGVPFREKVELAKTLPNGTSVDSGVGSGDLGLGKNKPGPNHMGIDMKGNQIKNQLDDALKLREGSGSSSTAPSNDVVNPLAIGGSHAKTDKTYHNGFNRPGMSLISDENPYVNKNGNTKSPHLLGFLGLGGDDKKAPDVKGDIEAMKAELKRRTEEAQAKKPAPDGGVPDAGTNKPTTDGGKPDGGIKLTNPDAPEGTQPPVVTGETLHKIELRKNVNTQPGVQEDLEEIDGKVLSNTDPRRKLFTDPLPDSDQNATGTGVGITIKEGAKGPDSVNPRDPELGGGREPIVIDPDRTK